MKLHLGCGNRYLVGYTHIDHNDFPRLDFKHDISKLPMIDDESVSIIYAAHVLEHFDDVKSLDVLQEWYKKLKKGGILRLAVPNFPVLLNLYTQYKDLKMLTGPILGKQRTSDGMFISDPSTSHRSLYDWDKLSKRLLHIGFQEVSTWNWREVFIGELEGFDDYSQAYIPHLDKENGTLISLNVEGTK